MIVSAKLHAALQEKFDELQAKLGTAETDLKAAQETISEHVETISAANGQIEKLTAEVNDFKSKAEEVEKKEKEVEEKEKKIDEEVETKAADKAIETVAKTGTAVINKPAPASEAPIDITVAPKSYEEFNEVFVQLTEKSPAQAGAYLKLHAKAVFPKR